MDEQDIRGRSLADIIEKEEIDFFLPKRWIFLMFASHVFSGRLYGDKLCFDLHDLNMISND